MDLRFLFLAVCMVVFGSINTITTKIADITSSKGINGQVAVFDHPFFQAAGMFLGEFLCMIAFRVMVCYNAQTGKQMERAQFNPLIFVLPACCDMTATSLMYIGLNWTYASVFQMLRGAVIIFTGIMSVIFLGKKLRLYHWCGMILVLLGLSCVGVASVLYTDGNTAGASHPLLGDVVIICAQVVVSVQMVVEEKFIGKYKVPALQVVGWEGLFGFCILSCLLVVFYFIPGHFEDSPDAFAQMSNSWVISVAVLGNILSIAFFNHFGISITKYASATTRMVMDSIRTVVIWVISLILKWQEFQYLQLVGFLLLLLGTCVYNEILIIPMLGIPEQWSKKIGREEKEESAPLLEEPIN